MIDREALARLHENNLEVLLNSKLSDLGYPQDSVYKLFRFITAIYKQLPPELITWKFNVVLPVGNWNFDDKTINNINNLGRVFTEACTILAVSDTQFIIERYDNEFSDAHIRYSYYSSLNEKIVLGEDEIRLDQYCESTASSIFAQPTYRELDEAMDFYYERFARTSSCLILNQAWEDTSKCEFIAKPEHFMRDSLYQCLQAVLRNHSVKREQNVDATHPVDIKVIWPVITNVALIEVKWLGDSGSTHYRDKRANEGAKQLIDYIASSVEEEPDKHFIGYLTVFDGRRGKNKNQYASKEIKYKPEYLGNPLMKFRRFYMQQA